MGEEPYALPAALDFRYEYLTFKRDFVVETLRPVDREAMPGAFLSDDFETRALREALDTGYRWVRTDGETAVFERRTLRLTGRTKEKRPT